MNQPQITAGVWSATPTPFNNNCQIDTVSVEKMVLHHLDMGVSGLMLCGTCGEGAWLRARDRRVLVEAAAKAADGRLRVAAQVTDNSAGRVLDNIEEVAAAGAEIAVVDAPYFFMNATPERRFHHYRDIIRRSPLPIGLYDRGAANPNSIPGEYLAELLAEPNVIMVKDSSGNPERRAAYVEARKARQGLLLLNGDEFKCVDYLQAGYDGLLLGGGVFNARIAWQIVNAVRAGNIEEADLLQKRMTDIMLRVYGGPKIECWLTGLKELLVQMGVFATNASLLQYPLTDECRAQIAAAVSGADGMGFKADLLGDFSREAALPAK